MYCMNGLRGMSRVSVFIALYSYRPDSVPYARFTLLLNEASERRQDQKQDG